MFGRHLSDVYVLGDALLEKPEYLVLGNRFHISRDLDPVCFIPISASELQLRDDVGSFFRTPPCSSNSMLCPSDSL
jgi:hypothetical protein